MRKTVHLISYYVRSSNVNLINGDWIIKTVILTPKSDERCKSSVSRTHCAGTCGPAKQQCVSANGMGGWVVEWVGG